MITTTTCSHCHASNPASQGVCAECGHDAQRPRMDCTCFRCVPGEAAGYSPEEEARINEYEMWGPKGRPF